MILVPIGSGKVGSCLVIFLMSNNFKIAIFSSGSGSNFEAIVKAKIPNVEVSFLFCNVEDAFVLERAKNLGIESIILSHKGYKLRKEYEEKIISIIGGAGHVGFPLGLAFAAKGFNINFVDLNKKNLNKIKSGIPPFMEKGARFVLNSCLKKNRFEFNFKI